MGYKIFLPLANKEEPPHLLFFRLLQAQPGQEHPVLKWDECLVEAAKLRAEQASIEWGHCYVGNCVNRIVRAYCPLPSAYPENGNSIESLVGGQKKPEDALAALLRSEKHCAHLLGKSDFFRRQIRCGIGYCYRSESQYQYYYAVLLSE